jgi:hypothetical protein
MHGSGLIPKASLKQNLTNKEGIEMTNHNENESQYKTSGVADMALRKAALIAGFGLLIMTIAAIFAEFARTSLIVAGDATTTANNIIAKEVLFRSGIFGYLIVIMLDVIVAWALYVFLKPVNKNLSLLAGWFRIVYAAVFGASLLNLVTVLGFLNSSVYLKVLGTDQLYTQLMLSLNAFNNDWNIALVFFGLHLGLLGYLVLKSNYIPKFLGILLIIAGLGYLIDSLGKILIPGYNVTIAMFTFIGELLLMFWLLIKGSKNQEDRA